MTDIFTDRHSGASQNYRCRTSVQTYIVRSQSKCVAAAAYAGTATAARSKYSPSVSSRSTSTKETASPGRTGPPSSKACSS